MSSSPALSFTVTYRGTSHALSLLSDTTISVLQTRLEELTNVPPALQKLIYKGKNLFGTDTQDRETTTLAQSGFKNGLKIQMLGSTSQELTSLQSTENEQRTRERILRERALKAPTKLRSTGTSSSALFTYRFHQLTPLAHLPNPSGALALLTKLSEDPAIQHIMQLHKFSVGVLTELAPHEHPELLGLNVNAGQAIKLRLRTDRYDGFRLYKDVRRVLCHELTHNVWGAHDENFKELNSKLNREVAEFERAAAQGTHYLDRPDEVYEPSSELEAEAHSHVLGGGSAPGLGPAMDDTREERRRRVLAATMARLRKEEEELEQSCGTRPGGT
ncbi:putative WLM-domain-containing protein [Lyophyllum shimeji]|uniref:WLM-domain-containing protein n=1 Tax=Lyophyllum shimeji TaxID=47721 RepID=A0A9P3PRX7_LYOSH|nr:putative WLM-domain-containing protein [Lyophyllum shimeji]